VNIGSWKIPSRWTDEADGDYMRAKRARHAI
jgi:hypothetical protein